MRGCDALGLDPFAQRGEHYTVADEGGQHLFIEVLKLAASATAEMTARRKCVMGARLHTAIHLHDVTRRSPRDVATARRHAIAFRGDADDCFRYCHRKRA